MELLHPGVYIREVPSGVNPIEGVSTSTAAFVGAAKMGPVQKAVLTTSLGEFETVFGGYVASNQLAPAVFQFFNNGGRKCYVVRAVGPGTSAAEITIRDRKSSAAATLVIRALSPGAWGNSLDVTIANSRVDPDNEFALSIIQDRSDFEPPLPPLLLETFDGLNMTPGAAGFVEKAINGKSKFIEVTALAANLATAGAGSSRSGRLVVGDGADLLKLTPATGAIATAGAVGSPATSGSYRSGDTPNVNPPADRRRIAISLDADEKQEIVISSAATTGESIAASIQAEVRKLTARNPARQTAFSGFTATYETPPAGAAPFLRLTSGTAGAASSVAVSSPTQANGGAAALGLGVANGGVETAGVAGPTPTGGTSRGAVNPSTNPPADSRRFAINVDGDGPQTITVPSGASTGAAIATAIQAAVRALTASVPARQPAFDGFTANYRPAAGPAQPFYELASGSTGTASSIVVTSAVAAGGVSLPSGPGRFAIEINGDGPHAVQLVGPLADGTAIAAAIQLAVRALTPNRAANAAAFTSFACVYDNSGGGENPSLLLTSGVQGPSSSVRVRNATIANIATTLRLGLVNGGRETIGSALLNPASSQIPTEYHLGVGTVSGNVAGAIPGSDGVPPGDSEYKNGLTALDIVRDVNIVAIPGVSSPDVVSTGVNYCSQRGDCFFIGDVDPEANDVEKARTYIDALTVKSSYGAVYYPWLRIADPSGRSSQPILAPPSGFVAGMYARIDSRRGVFKAPAGTEANVGGAIGLAAETTDVQQDFLNPIGLNVIRSFPASGMVIWGARTLATRSDPEYRYIPVRRLAIFLEQSIYNGIQFAVFEPNDEPLWSSLRLNIGAFMFTQFRAGAFQGKSANDAFFVKCDSSTTTQQDIDLGRVNIKVGFAPLKPAEFVVLQLMQKIGQAAG